MFSYFKLLFTVSMILLGVSGNASDGLDTCVFDPQLGSAVCSDEVEQYSFPVVSDSLQLAIDDYINNYQKMNPPSNEIHERLGGLYTDVRENFSQIAFELDELLASLKADLSSFEEYLDNQKQVLRTVLVAFHALGENSTVYSEFAEEVFSCAAQFLKASLDSVPPLKDSSHMVQDVSYPVEILHYLTMAEHYSLSSQAIPHIDFIFLVKNLGRTLKIRSLKQLVPFEANSWFSQYSPEEIEKAIHYLGLSWLHGTKAYSLKSAQAYTDGYFLPSGILYKKNVEMLSGKLDGGATAIGVNRKSLSGCALESYEEILHYANGGKLSINDEKQKFEQLLQLNLGQDWSKYSDSDGKFSRLVKAVSRVKGADYAYFEARKEELTNKVFEIYQSLEENIFGNHPDSELENYFFHWHDTYYSSKLYSFLIVLQRLGTVIEEPQKEVLASDVELGKIPAVIGSFNRLGTPLRIGMSNYLMTEHLYEGVLKLGEEIQVVFVYERDLPAIENLIKEIGLEDRVKVESMKVLEMAGKLDRQLSGYLQDPYNLPGDLDSLPSEPYSFPIGDWVDWLDQSFQLFYEHLPAL